MATRDFNQVMASLIDNEYTDTGASNMSVATHSTYASETFNQLETEVHALSA